MKAGSAILIDVRPSDEYEAGHIPGALNFPLDEIESRLTELPKGREVVAYCRGPYCVQSIKALELLHAKGFKTRRLSSGVQEWFREGSRKAVA
jgi:ArsR family transcriptional regulator